MLRESEGVVTAGTALVEVGDPSVLEVAADLSTVEAVRVRPGMAAFIDHWGGPHALAARVRSVEPSGFTKVSALGVEEQRVERRRLSRVLRRRLRHRYRVGVRIVLWERPDVLRVPAGALFRDAAGWGVYVVEDGRARRRALTLGHQSADWAEVLQGLAGGEVVVLIELTGSPTARG